MNNTVESLKTVPQNLREGALALGCGKWHMIRTVVLPNALSGILTGSILAVGRIVGESGSTAFYGRVRNEAFGLCRRIAVIIGNFERGALYIRKRRRPLRCCFCNNGGFDSGERGAELMRNTCGRNIQKKEGIKWIIL